MTDIASMEALLDQRAWDLLERFAEEHPSPWYRRIGARWKYSDEPLRNDAANLLQQRARIAIERKP